MIAQRNRQHTTLSGHSLQDTASTDRIEETPKNVMEETHQSVVEETPQHVTEETPQHAGSSNVGGGGCSWPDFLTCCSNGQDFYQVEQVPETHSIDSNADAQTDSTTESLNV